MKRKCIMLIVILAFSILMTISVFAAPSDYVYQVRFDDLSKKEDIAYHGTGGGWNMSFITLATDEFRGETGKSFLASGLRQYYWRQYFSGYFNAAVEQQPNEVYEMSAWVKVADTNESEGSRMLFGPYIVGDNTSVPYPPNSYADVVVSKNDGWTKLQTTYTVTQANPNVRIAVEPRGNPFITDYYLDDIVASKKYRAFFDDVPILGLSGVSTVDGGTIAIDSNENHIGEGKSIRHSSRSSLNSKVVLNNLLNNYDKSPGRAYDIWAWVKINDNNSIDQGEMILAVMDNNNEENYTKSKPFVINKDGWTKLEMTYIMPQKSGDVITPQGIAVTQNSGEIIGHINVDDICILPIGTKKIFDTDNDVPDDIVVTGGGIASISRDYHNHATGASLAVTNRTDVTDRIALVEPITEEEYEYKKLYILRMNVMSPYSGIVKPFVEFEDGKFIYGDEISLEHHYWKETVLPVRLTSVPQSIGIVQSDGQVLDTIYVDDISFFESKYYEETYIINVTPDETGNIIVDGVLKSGNENATINIKVLKSGKTLDDIDNPSAILVSKDVVVDADNIYSVSLDCTDTVNVNTDLILVIGGINNYPISYIETSFQYTNPMAIGRIMNQIDEVSSSGEIKDIIEQGGVFEDLGLNEISLPELNSYDFVYDYVFKLNPFGDVVDFVEAFRKGWLIACFNEISDETLLLRVLKDNEQALGISEYTAYKATFKDLSDEYKRSVLTAAVSKTGNPKFEVEGDLIDFICFESIIKGIESRVNYLSKIQILIDNSEYLEIDFSKYNNLDTNGKTIVGTELAEYATSISNLNRISTYLDERIVAYQQTNGQQQGIGGGSSRPGGTGNTRGSTGGTSISVSDSPITQIINEEKIKVFADIEEVQWAKESINKLVARGVLKGYEDGTFRPNQKVTRAEFVTMIISMFMLTDDTANAEFEDINKEDWHYVYVATAQKLGIISGDDVGNFNSNAEISREDLAVISYRLLDNIGIDIPLLYEKIYFIDRAEISPYAEDAVVALQRAGVINGNDEQNFLPKHSASRAECTKILCGLLGLDW